MDFQIIAFYLPQFHPFKENNEWWGKGFTEWTNVGKAKPLFKGHNQPRVPTELGYYDLRLPIVREQQAQMARDAGVTAFCYWHYWFGNGRRLIPEVFDEVLESGKPDFPFCLGWANHSWYAKNWNSDGVTAQKLLMEQTYPGREDEILHFSFLCKAFKDKRYVKIEGAPLLYIFDPINMPANYVNHLKAWTKKAGFPDLYLVAKLKPTEKLDESLKMVYNAIAYERLGGNQPARKVKGVNFIQRNWKKIKGLIEGHPPFLYDYRLSYKKLITKNEFNEDVIPVLIPQWDHTPRSGWNGSLYIHATPEFFKKHAVEVLNAVRKKKNKIIFLKSWNEWGEGNMMEPDITYGRGFINALREAIESIK